MEILKKEDRRNIKPKFVGSKEQKAKGQGRVVMINMSESSLDILRSKKVINTQQYYTALRVRRLWEKSRIGSYTSNFNKVGDISGWNDMATDRIDAIYKLSRLHKWLGDKAFGLVYKICVEDYTIKETSAMYQVDRVYLGKRFRESIDESQIYFDKNTN
tara:strand:+ start:754 stop:1230 length:477 start_codon:yes stop_codon:yes gene_type:complete